MKRKRSKVMAEQQDIDAIVKKAVQKQLMQYRLQVLRQQSQQRQAQKQAQARRPHPARRRKPKRQKPQKQPERPINPYVANLASLLWQNVVVPAQPVSSFITIRGDNNTCQINYNPYSGEFAANYRGKSKQYMLFTKYEWDIQGLANDLYSFLESSKKQDKSPLDPQTKQDPKTPPFSISKAVGR